MDEEKTKIKMDDGVARFFARSLLRDFVYLLTCGRRRLVSETQNEIVVELPCEG